MAQKDRNITLFEYFDCLQIEYYIAEIRSKIYPTKHVEFHKNLMEKKAEKIKDIALKNGLNSIFNCSETKEKYVKKVYGEGGLPNFGRYQNKFDERNYFAKNSQVKIHMLDGTYGIGVIIGFQPQDGKLVVEKNNGEKILTDKSIISRIL